MQTEAAKRWFSSVHSVSSQLGLHEKGVESQLLLPPRVGSSLGEGLPECLGDKLQMGSHSIPLHETDVTKNHSLLQELMLHYNIVGVRANMGYGQYTEYGAIYGAWANIIMGIIMEYYHVCVGVCTTGMGNSSWKGSGSPGDLL